MFCVFKTLYYNIIGIALLSSDITKTTIFCGCGVGLWMFLVHIVFLMFLF